MRINTVNSRWLYLTKKIPIQMWCLHNKVRLWSFYIWTCDVSIAMQFFSCWGSNSKTCYYHSGNTIPLLCCNPTAGIEDHAISAFFATIWGLNLTITMVHITSSPLLLYKEYWWSKSHPLPYPFYKSDAFGWKMKTVRQFCKISKIEGVINVYEPELANLSNIVQKWHILSSLPQYVLLPDNAKLYVQWIWGFLSHPCTGIIPEQ